MNDVDVIIAIDDARQADVRNLLEEANGYLRSLYPSQNNHPIDANALSAPGVILLTARSGGTLLGSIAYRLVGHGHAEIKRLFVSECARATGLGRRLLIALESEARRRGIDRLSLEAGIRQPAAIRLYQSSGYEPFEPFGENKPDPLSLFMTKRL
ncbi:GNAT family N-acetyltransferase [Bradyrhizobium ontarionense]|uniref:GNAT family N-acetyltransferase n=1 Tax=Bradyrhizobium ontarionense TaxID=2898149 RepID=A0ABY3R5G3_9BRAD|nr:GNAT family N-acetyltransferase [Bradyrhizobium sp. A19]UFZ02428.1 GNAT family N-acetyltransferase [Bradyrhizobium sp. A19]